MCVTSLIREFTQPFQDFSITEKEIKLFLTPFLMDAGEVEKTLQLQLMKLRNAV